MLKTFVDGIKPIWQALAGVNSDELTKIREVPVSNDLRSMSIDVYASYASQRTTKTSRSSSKERSMTMWSFPPGR
jgi:hypothetical protein